MRELEPQLVDGVRAMIRNMRAGPADKAAANVARAESGNARFEWSEYECLMISEALHRGETVYNIALRIDPNSLMRAAAFQLIRNVLHGCGTVIALRPEDNVGAASVEIVEAALATSQPQARVAQRCNIPSIVSTVRLERAAPRKLPNTNCSVICWRRRQPRPLMGLPKTARTADQRRPPIPAP